MTPNEHQLDDENAHVQELKRLFLSSNVDENKCLNSAGLQALFTKLKLSEYAKEITERVLCGQLTVDFENFKERFVSYLPEIIDVSSGTVDTLLARSQQTAQKLGLRDLQSLSVNTEVEGGFFVLHASNKHFLTLRVVRNEIKLTRYETRLLCESTKELEQLSVVDINLLFERADSEKNGRVSMQQFLSQYRLQKRLSAEVHFIADSYVSSLNLFESLDPGRTGSVDSHDLMEMWNKAGLRIDEGLTLLKEAGQPMSGAINAVYLSGYLERELSHSTAEAPIAVRAAIISLHSCVDHLRCNVREGESRAEHLHNQLQLANQRRHLLIEELEHNQATIEQGYDKRIRETEERYRAKLIQMEDKFRVDKREIQNDLEQVEEELSRMRQQEVSLKNRVTLMERQSKRLNEETREQQETIGQLEQLNRQLRNELSKVMQPRPVEDNTQLLMWKQKVDLLVAHNKRLREKVTDLTASQKKKSRALSDGDALSSRWSSAFKTQITMIRKRRLARGDTLSELDSEPESIFVRHRHRRLQKRRERKTRHDAVAKRLWGNESGEESSSCGTSFRDQLFAQRMDEQLQKLKEDHKRELAMVRQTASRTMADALNEQEKQLSARFEREKKQFDVKLGTEKNAMERQFAEEKMKLMNRLQEDFDTELKRIASMVNRPENAATVEQYKRQIKMLESSLEGQKSGYEKRLGELREKYRNTVRAQTSSYIIDKNTTNFISLIEKYRNTGLPATLEPYTTSRSSLGVEKRPSATNHLFQRSLSSMSPRCEKCDITESRLREIYHTLVGDKTVVESGIEDIGSSAGSQTDDKSALKKELRKLKGRVDATTDKVTELRVLLAMQHTAREGSRTSRSENTWLHNGDREWKRQPAKWTDMAGAVERLESEKLLLEARLSESQALIKNLVEQYKTQLDESQRLGNLLKDVHSNH